MIAEPETATLPLPQKGAEATVAASEKNGKNKESKEAEKADK